MGKTHIVHLVKDEDRSQKACDGEIYIAPEGNVGDIMKLCPSCNALFREHINLKS